MTPSAIFSLTASPTSNSFWYTWAPSMCRYPASIASNTARFTSPGLDCEQEILACLALRGNTKDSLSMCPNQRWEFSRHCSATATATAFWFDSTLFHNLNLIILQFATDHQRFSNATVNNYDFAAEIPLGGISAAARIIRQVFDWLWVYYFIANKTLR